MDTLLLYVFLPFFLRPLSFFFFFPALLFYSFFFSFPFFFWWAEGRGSFFLSVFAAPFEFCTPGKTRAGPARDRGPVVLYITSFSFFASCSLEACWPLFSFAILPLAEGYSAWIVFPILSNIVLSILMRYSEQIREFLLASDKQRCVFINSYDIVILVFESIRLYRILYGNVCIMISALYCT